MPGITNPAEPYFKDGIWGWDGSVWRKLPLIWGYSDRWLEDLGGTKSGAGNYQKFGAVVPAGYVYVLQALFIRNDSGARGRAYLEVYDGSDMYSLVTVMVPARYEVCAWDGALVLKAGDRVVVTQHTCLDADVLKGGSWGYKMKVTE